MIEADDDDTGDGEWACPCINLKSSIVWSVQKLVPPFQRIMLFKQLDGPSSALSTY